MAIHQISVFVQNEPGFLGQICRLLGNQGFDILSHSLADAPQFGIFRLIVRDWEKALVALQSAGHLVRSDLVSAVQVSNRVGGLAEILEVIGQAGANVEYMYVFTLDCGEKAVIVFRFDNAAKAVNALKTSGFNVLSQEDLDKCAAKVRSEEACEKDKSIKIDN